MSSSQLNRRLRRFALKLQGLDLKIEYRPGVANGNADGLSRQNWGNNDDDRHEMSSNEIRDQLDDVPWRIQAYPLGKALRGGDVGPSPARVEEMQPEDNGYLYKRQREKKNKNKKKEETDRKK